MATKVARSSVIRSPLPLMLWALSAMVQAAHVNAPAVVKSIRPAFRQSPQHPESDTRSGRIIDLCKSRWERNGNRITLEIT
jgi:hypothetical protein